MKKVLISLSCALAFNAFANTDTTNLPIVHKDFKVTIDWLDKKPKSYSKDFFIIQYLKQDNISVENAKTVYDMAKRKSGRVKKAYNKKFSSIPSEDLKCYRAKTEDLVNFDDRCLALGLTIYESTTLSKKALKDILPRLEKYPTLRNDLKVISSKDPYSKLLESNPNRFYRLFFKAGKGFRKNEFNQIIPSEFINRITSDKKFNKFVRYIVTNPNLTNLQKSLYEVSNNKTITHQTLFFLAMNAIKHDKKEISLAYLDKAYKKAYFQMDKDKVNFWRLLVSKNRTYIDKITSSWDNNIYSLYMKEIMRLKPDNIVHNIEQKNTVSNFDILDNFSWMDILSDTKKNLDEVKYNKYYDLFTDENTLPHLAYILERYKKYRTQYFITPYRNVFNKYDVNKQVLMYAIGKQESRFIPSSISFATAQGMMQIMPFLSKALAKDLKEPYNIYHQFIPETNIRYASKHLDTLKKQFKNNPLFIAYAYNGGGGFTRKQFKRGLFKKSESRFEPFLSMELIEYDETRRYGKKVLANYYIYNNYLNKENSVKLSSIFQTLVAPKKYSN